VKFPDGTKRCATMEMDSIRRANNPALPSLEEREAWLQSKITEYLLNKSNKATIVTIPVIVHVIHNGDAIGVNENISDAQVMSQIDVLNQDYRRMTGTNGFNSNPVGADVEIEFCLAQFDTLGNAINGIDRQNLGQTSWDATTINNTVKPLTIWDPTKYMNIWTVDFGSTGILAYTQLPDNSGLSGLNTTNGAANTDGVVIGYQYFGSIDIAPSGTYTSPYDRGRTATHEIGHFFGLKHIWGDGACGVDDYCADTPESANYHFGCPVDTTCGTPDMVENYMDYTDDICMNIFTQDQKTRMRTVLLNSPRRMELVNSTVCGLVTTTDVGISDIYAPLDSICDSIINPFVKLYNFGTVILQNVEIKYGVDNDSSNVFSWSGTIQPGGFELVALPSINVAYGYHTFSAFTANPNGTMDEFIANDITVTDFTLSPCGVGLISNNVFTPNHDGVNDGFIFDIPQLIQNENRVIIYNRWGDVIREFVNYNNNDVIWKGFDKNGNEVAKGTYYFVIEMPVINYSNSGWIQVVR